jgi:hypothetical protein
LAAKRNVPHHSQDLNFIAGHFTDWQPSHLLYYYYVSSSSLFHVTTFQDVLPPKLRMNLFHPSKPYVQAILVRTILTTQYELYKSWRSFLSNYFHTTLNLCWGQKLVNLYCFNVIVSGTQVLKSYVSEQAMGQDTEIRGTLSLFWDL